MQEVPLIQKKESRGTVQYEICKQGLSLLRTLKTKKVRIIFNITYEATSLSGFNNWLFGISEEQRKCSLKENVCLTISKHPHELEGDRVILILNAYEQPESEPFMVLLGYLAASVFIYHHFTSDLSEESHLTRLLGRLKHLLTATNINNLNREMTYKKGYSKNPHFLCLLSEKYLKFEGDSFKEFYRYSQGGREAINESVDALIDFLPERSSLALPATRESIHQIGKQFQQNVLGRQIFNFQFTGSTIQNLCFECCEAFNNSKSLNLNLVYSKIIQNQKTRLEDEAIQRYLSCISTVFFGGNKIDYNGSNAFPISTSSLLQKHNEISESILDQTVKLASYCMDISEYKKLQLSLRQKFKQTLNELQNANNQKIEQFCRECFQLLENLQEFQITSSILNDIFRQISNKFELFTSECSEAIGRDVSFRIFTNYLNRLESTILTKFSSNLVEAFENYEIKIQEYKVEKEDLKYNLRLVQTKLRELQYKYNLQEDILSEYKIKLVHEPQPVNQSLYSLDLNKFRKRVQELEEQVQDKDLYIEQLEGIIERFEGLGQRDKLKYKFSKEIVQMIKEVSNEVNGYYTFIKEVKSKNQLCEEVKEEFAKERQLILEQHKKSMLEIGTRESEFHKIIKEKTLLEEVINEARQSIQVYKQVDENYKDSISNLENTYTQAQCLLAQTQNQLQFYKKGLSLISEQQLKGSKLESLNKFFRVSSNPELKELLKPFLKR